MAALLVGTLLLVVGTGAKASDIRVESYCPAGECPFDDDYSLTGFRQTEPLVTFVYYSQGAPYGSQVAAVGAGVEEWGAATNSVTNTVMAQAAGAPVTHLCGGDYGAPMARGLNGQNDIIWAPLAGGAIGRACWSGADEADVVLDSGWAGFANVGATRTVVLHEVGHAVGLSHTNVLGAVMYPSYSSPLPLHPDDLAGFCAVYGCGVVDTPTPTATPTATSPTPTATPTPTVVIYRKFVPGVIRD